MTLLIIPCRACHARPGFPCTLRGGYCATREADWVLSSAMIATYEKRPAVVVKRKAAR